MDEINTKRILGVEIGERIREKLIEAGLSVHALEKKAGLRPSAIQNILYGKSKKPSINTIQAIARALNCTVPDLLEENENPFQGISRQEEKYISQTNEWNIDLYINTLKIVSNLLKNKNISLPKEKTLEYADEIYTYSLKTKSNAVDEIFADWIIEKEL